MPNGRFSPAQIDFGMLANLPNVYAQGEEVGRQRNLRNEMQSAIRPDGTFDFQRGMAILSQHDPVAGMKIQSDYMNTQALNSLKQFSALPDDFKAMHLIGGGFSGGAQPAPGQTAPTQAAPVGSAPTAYPAENTAQNATPQFMEKYTMSSEDIEAGKKRGGNVVEEEKKQRGRENLNEILTQVTGAYLGLHQRGGTIDPRHGVGANISAGLAASPAGQYITGLQGTEEQQLRDKINTMRPALINAIRSATGMSAKAMDSNTELQFYLQQATDPQRGFLANLQAIDLLDKQYGLGGVLDNALPPEVLARVRSGGATSVYPKTNPPPEQDPLGLFQ